MSIYGNPIMLGGSGGGSGVPLMTKAEWSALTTEEKQSYGLVAVQEANTGYKRGILYYGEDYLSSLLPNSVAADILTEDFCDTYMGGQPSWGGWDITNYSGATIGGDGRIVFARGTYATFDLTAANQEVTIYAVIRNHTNANWNYIYGVPYGMSTGNGLGFANYTGILRPTSYNYDYTTGLSSIDTWYALAISVNQSTKRGACFADGTKYADATINNTGDKVWIAWAPGNETVRQSAVDVLYAAVVNGTEADATVIANLQNIMAYYDSIFGT